ncbi:hypothetical protein [Bosea sp. (in: a-proteobacteria)]|uniref:hypothetical protein n=1 Tax=Bosea sp. (in: a-proteobacteria) TaxID=1871050 RepID=UPI003B3B9B3F
MTMRAPRSHIFATGLVAAIALLFTVTVADTARAEVRFGGNVRVGGHDFSHRSYDRKRRAVIHIHEGRPARPGCSWRADGRGGRVQTCHLQRRH